MAENNKTVFEVPKMGCNQYTVTDTSTGKLVTTYVTVYADGRIKTSPVKYQKMINRAGRKYYYVKFRNRPDGMARVEYIEYMETYPDAKNPEKYLREYGFVDERKYARPYPQTYLFQLRRQLRTSEQIQALVAAGATYAICPFTPAELDENEWGKWQQIMTPEGKFKKDVCEYLTSLEKHYNVIFERRQAMPVGGYKIGSADIWACINGTHIEIELKAKEGHLRALQIKWKEKCDKKNIPCICVDNLDELKEFLVPYLS